MSPSPVAEDTRKPKPKPKIIIIGGGFAGISLVKSLGGAHAAIQLIDRQNYHLFQPLLYQVATASLSPAEIAQPIRRIFRKRDDVSVLMEQVTSIDVESRMVETTSGAHPYDYLVIATGVTHSYYGHDEWSKVAPGLKTIDDALEIRRRVLLAFEKAEQAEDARERRALLTFVIVGGGPTGVELAGALSDIVSRSIPRDFRKIDTKTARIILVEGSDRLLKAFPPELSARAQQDLESMGVEIHLGVHAQDLNNQGLKIGDEVVESDTVLWAAGVQASPLARSLNVPLDRIGRVLVQPDLTIPDHPEVFVVGDLAALDDPKTGQPVPGVAPAAMQMGRYVARWLKREMRSGKTIDRPPFHYHDKGSLATIGRASAVAAIGPWRLKGFVAWLLWSLVHLAYLISFRNRILVMISWVWSYLTFSRGARLITGRRPWE